MYMNVLKLKQYLHISMLKNHKNGIGYRYAEMDKFIEAKKFQKVKKYSQFIHDQEEMMKERITFSE